MGAPMCRGEAAKAQPEQFPHDRGGAQRPMDSGPRRLDGMDHEGATLTECDSTLVSVTDHCCQSVTEMRVPGTA